MMSLTKHSMARNNRELCMRENLITLADRLLDDDYGISEDAFAALLKAFDGDQVILGLLSGAVDGTDGRVYYRSGFVGLRAAM